MGLQNKPVPKATNTVFGKVRLSVAATNPADPIVVGINDPILIGIGITSGSQVGIVAGVVQTQGGATQLTKKRNIVATVTTALDGIKASLAVANMEQYVKNEGLNSFNFYPFLGNNFLGLAVNLPILIMKNNAVTVYCYEGETGILRYK